MKLQGSTFCLREWQLTDEEALLKYANNINVSRYLADRFPHPYTLADAQYWLNYTTTASPVVNFAIDISGEAVGGIGFEIREGERRKTAHLGYWLGEPFWEKQIMQQATALIVNYAFDNFDLARLEAVVYHPNVASMRVLEKAGFVKEGISKKAIFKNDEFYDEHVFALVK